MFTYASVIRIIISRLAEAKMQAYLSGCQKCLRSGAI